MADGLLSENTQLVDSHSLLYTKGSSFMIPGSVDFLCLMQHILSAHKATLTTLLKLSVTVKQDKGPISSESCF